MRSGTKKRKKRKKKPRFLLNVNFCALSSRDVKFTSTEFWEVASADKTKAICMAVYYFILGRGGGLVGCREHQTWVNGKFT